MNDSIGFRPDFVRLYNQLEFSLFSNTHAAKIIIGKKGYLFSDEYIYSYTGKNFVGKNIIREKVKRIKFIQDILWNNYRILLLVVFPPDKGTFYREYIPDRFLRNINKNTNVSEYSKEFEKAGVNFINFNPWFLSMKDTSEFVLYPKTGIHWSNYGAFLAADSLSSYIAEKLSVKLPRLVLDSVPVSDIVKDPDDDISKTLNMIWPAHHPPMAYPWFHADTTGGRKKIRALFIGDSFYWNLFNIGYISSTYQTPSFWYYYKDIYPSSFKSPMDIRAINPADTVFAQNVIILLQVNGGYGKLDYGFSDDMYFSLDQGNEEILEMEKKIRGNPKWIDLLKKKAKERHLTLDEMIRNDAIYMINQQIQKTPENKQP